MGLQDFIRGLVPKEERFFDLLEQQARTAHEAAKLFMTFADGVKVGAISAGLQEIEHRGDALAHEVEETLAKTYVTPIDREDIHGLSGELDDVLDLANQAARACELMGVETPTPAMAGLIGVLVKSTETLAEVVPLLRKRDYAGIIAGKRKVRALEKEADRLHRDAISALFATEVTDARVILREREVLEDLENAIDHCERVSDTLANLAVKHG